MARIPLDATVVDTIIEELLGKELSATDLGNSIQAARALHRHCQAWNRKLKDVGKGRSSSINTPHGALVAATNDIFSGATSAGEALLAEGVAALGLDACQPRTVVRLREPLLVAAAARAAALAAIDADAAPALLKEPWLSFLVTALAETVMVDTSFSGPDNIDLAISLAAGAALASAALCIRKDSVLWHSGPEEAGTRGVARLRTELVVPKCISAIVQQASTMGHHCATSEGSNMPALEDNERRNDINESIALDAQRALTSSCRSLLDLLADDVSACEMLIQQGAVPAVLQVAQAEGGARCAGLGGVLAALSTAPGFVTALAHLPPHDACVLVELAMMEMSQVSIATAGEGLVSPALYALFNVCRATPPLPLAQRLADRGAISLLADVLTQSESISENTRLEAADALCRIMLPDDGDSDSNIPKAALRTLAAPKIVRALIALSGTNGVAGRQSVLPGGSSEALKYRLPWLLSCIARDAATTDLITWVEEESGIRVLLSEAFNRNRAREVRGWGLDLIAALCGRLAPEQIVAFLRRGHQPLLGKWTILLDTESQSVRARAVIVAYFLASCSSSSSMNSLCSERQEVLSLISLRRVPPRFWEMAEHSSLSGAQKQLAEIASTAAAVIVAEPLSQRQRSKQQWPELVTLCQLVAVGLEAQEAVVQHRIKIGIGINADNTSGSASAYAWLFDALTWIGEFLKAPDNAPNDSSFHTEVVALLTHLLEGSARPRTLQKCDQDDAGDDSDMDVQSQSPDGGSLERLRTIASQLLEGILLGPVLYPQIEMILSKQERMEDRLLMPQEKVRLSQEADFKRPLMVLTNVARSFGTQHYGRLLTRFLLRAFLTCSDSKEGDPTDISDQAKDKVENRSTAEDISLHSQVPRHVRVAAALSQGQKQDSGAKLWQPLDAELRNAALLDAAVAAEMGSSVSQGAAASGFPTCTSGGPLFRRWVGELLTAQRCKGVRAMLQFLRHLHVQTISSQSTTGKHISDCHVLLTSFVFKVLAANRDPLKLGTNERVVEELLGVAASHLEAAIGALNAFSTQEEGAKIGAPLELHVAVVNALHLASVASHWQATTLAEAFAYIWALVHVSSAGDLPDLREQEIEVEAQTALRVQMWTTATEALTAMLGNQKVLETIYHSDDNAAVLAPIRCALGSFSASIPLFARGSLQESKSTAAYFFGPPPRGSVKDMLGRVAPVAARDSPIVASTPPRWGYLDLHEESWCPPGRILLAAASRLISLVLRPAGVVVHTNCKKVLAITVNAAARLIAAVAKPGNLLHCGDDVTALVTAASALLAEPPLDANDEADEETSTSWRRRAGLLLVPLLHRPPIEALLAPSTSMETLVDVPHGLQGLKWCAQLDAETGLGPWGARARTLLSMQDGGYAEERLPAVAKEESDETLDDDTDGSAIGSRAMPLNPSCADTEAAEKTILDIPQKTVGENSVGSAVQEDPSTLSQSEEEKLGAAFQNDALTKNVEALKLREEVSALDCDLAALEAELKAELDVEFDTLDNAHAGKTVQNLVCHEQRSARAAEKRSKLVVEHHRVPSEPHELQAGSLSKAGSQIQASASRNIGTGSNTSLDQSTRSAEKRSKLVVQHYVVADTPGELQATRSNGTYEAVKHGDMNSHGDAFGQTSADTRADIGVDPIVFSDANSDDVEQQWHMTTQNTCEWEELSPVELARMCDPSFEKIGSTGQNNEENIAIVDDLVSADTGVGKVATQPKGGLSTSTGLSTEAHQFLISLMTGSGEFEAARDAILSLLKQTLRKNGSSAEFQAAGLIEVFRDCGEPPDAQHVRGALAYLFDHAPQSNEDVQILDDEEDTDVEPHIMEGAHSAPDSSLMEMD